jgi:hypothetical protein
MAESKAKNMSKRESIHTTMSKDLKKDKESGRSSAKRGTIGK